MTDTLPLYLHGAKPHHIAALKAAKQSLDLGVQFQVVEAQPGQGGRVLAFGEHPPFISESLLVASAEMAPDALRWAAGADVPGVETYEMKLSRWMSSDVREIAHAR